MPLLNEANCPEDLLEDIMKGSTFGNATPEEIMAGRLTHAAMRDSDNNNQKNKNTLANIWQAAFPVRRYMEIHYLEVKEKSWMLIPCYIKRWKKYLRQKSTTNQTLEGIKISKQRIELLKKYNIL